MAAFCELGHDVVPIEGGPPDLGIFWGLSHAAYLDRWIGEEIAARQSDVTRTLVKLIEAARGTVRAGSSRAGLPVGLQIVGPRGSDDWVLRVARAFEKHRPWHPDWPVAR